MAKFDLRSMSTKTKVIIISSLVLVIAAVVLAIVLTRGYYAKTMRLLRIEGTVSVEDANGNERAITENMRFQSGQAINTASASLAAIGLDDHKVVTLQENSRAEFRKAGKKLELMLTKGGVFFEVDKPLETDETFDIRTSTMIVGIRGTSGYVYVDEEGHECLMITDGHVHVRGINPVTGEEKEIDVYAGQRIRVYLYNDRSVDSIMFELEDVDEPGIPEFAREIMLDDPELLAKICADAGWDADIIRGIEDGTFVIEEVEETEDTPSPTPTNTATPTPTRRPGATATPTATPTAANTNRPSASPAAGGGNGGGNNGGGNDPSATPSSVPTITPGTTTPTGGATNTPSATPTNVPTSVPTGSGPTSVPTITPTTTTAPTGNPSTSPTTSPTVTGSPTGEPTSEPTSDPTPEPTTFEPEPVYPPKLNEDGLWEYTDDYGNALSGFMSEDMEENEYYFTEEYCETGKIKRTCFYYLYLDEDNEVQFELVPEDLLYEDEYAGMPEHYPFEGCTEDNYVVWGDFDYTIFIVNQPGDGGETLWGYYRDEWVHLTSEDDEEDEGYKTFYIEGTETEYYTGYFG